MATSPEIGNAPAQATLTMVQGDDWSRTFKFRRGTSTGTPIDLTTATLSAKIYAAYVDIEFTLPVTPVDLDQGEVSIAISDTISAALMAEAFDGDCRGHHLFVLKMTDSGGITRTLLRAKMIVRPTA